MTLNKSHVNTAPYEGRVRVEVDGTTIADSADAIELTEDGYAPVLYVPRRDVNMDLLAESEKQTVCPHKGTARYWHIRTDNARVDDAVWGYDEPIAQVAAIRDTVAFYSDKVRIETSPATAAAK